jgi:hypothetical protein
LFKKSSYFRDCQVVGQKRWDWNKTKKHLPAFAKKFKRRTCIDSIEQNARFVCEALKTYAKADRRMSTRTQNSSTRGAGTFDVLLEKASNPYLLMKRALCDPTTYSGLDLEGEAYEGFPKACYEGTCAKCGFEKWLGPLKNSLSARGDTALRLQWFEMVDRAGGNRVMEQVETRVTVNEALDFVSTDMKAYPDAAC